MRHIVLLSGGGTSYLTAKRVAATIDYPPELLFTDTLIEDDDLYRFLVESAADVLGVSQSDLEPVRWLLENIPPLDCSEEREAHLAYLAQVAMDCLPAMYWIQDGRNPWEVFRDVRFVGNSRAAPCAHQLKQDATRSWLEANCNPYDTTLYVGIHWSEMERFTGEGGKRGVREAWLPWRCEAPLCERPFGSADESFRLMKESGIRRPRLYDLGFSHNNCGGFCVKAGHGHFHRLLKTFPDKFAYHERKEQEMREYLDKDVSILRDRRGGVLKPMTLRSFRERTEAGEECDLTDIGGCDCFSAIKED